MFNVVIGYLADQREFKAFSDAVTFWLVTTKPANMYSLSLTNNATGTVWLQIFDEATSGATGVFRAFPCPGVGVVSVTDLKLGVGCFVRAATTSTGSVAPTTGTVQFSAAWMTTIV